MTPSKLALCTIIAGVLAGCGGSGGGAGGSTNANGGSTAALPVVDPPPPGPARNYADIASTTGTSPLLGAVLTAGASVSGTTGTINHENQTFSASGVSGSTSLNAGSGFSLPDFEFATDVEINAGTVAIVGVSTDAADMRSMGSAAFSGNFSGQLVDASLGGTATVLNWDADVQVNFSGNGDVDLTFTGSGSDLIDTIRINNAQISGATFSGGSLTTSNNGTRNNITGTSVDLDGAFFGYNNSLLLPGEAGGALVTNDADTDISGVFITTAKP